MKDLKKIMACGLTIGMMLTGCASSETPEEPKEEVKEEAKEETSTMVDEINLDNEEGTLKYTGFELSTNYDGQNAIIIYYDYTNKLVYSPIRHLDKGCTNRQNRPRM